jgi:hypothetical protein
MSVFELSGILGVDSKVPGVDVSLTPAGRK